MSTPVLTAVAWPYANGPRHIGHVSGFGVPSDVFSRYQRMVSNRVLMVSGTDEHGTPITVQADKEGMTSQQTADKYTRQIGQDLQGLGLTYDLFTRTTTGNHAEVTQQIFLALHRNGYVVPKTTRGAISPSTGRTLPDRYIEGTCPICGYDGARGDQCDNCGNQLDAAELINPKSRINGETPKFVETEHYFLDLTAFVDTLGKWLSSKTDWRPNVLNFTKNLIDDMRPRPITRDLDWGVKIPLDGWRDQPLKRFYVWFDAVIGYFSASVEWARRTGNPDAWQEWWNNPDARSYYFMGKDNITFHAQIWPALLFGHNGEGDRGGVAGKYGKLHLPDEIVSSEFLTMSGSKFSTSRGTVIYVHDFLRDFGPDTLRYFISVAGPETQDTDFTWDEFVRRTNFELANEWGNLVNRSISMAHKNVGAIPRPDAPTAADEELKELSRKAFDTMRRPLAAVPVQGRRERGHACRHRREPVPVGSGALEAQGRPRPARQRSPHRSAGRVGRQHAADSLPAPLGAEGARGPRRLGCLGGSARASGSRGPRHPRPDQPHPHRGLQGRAGALEVRADRGRQAAEEADPAVRQAGPGTRRDRSRMGPDLEMTD